MTLPFLANADDKSLASPSAEELPQKEVKAEAADSTHMLNEVVVEAPRVVRKADMDVYHPSKSAVEHAKNGMQLLRNCMVPGLVVNDALGSITMAGTAVQVRINGREATINEVKALLPESIKRVEWIDNPGLRYAGASYVLNVIVTNPEVGGSLMAQARPSLNGNFGNYFTDLKLNNGRSQWSLGGWLKATENLGVHREYWERFTRPDGESVTRTETPLGGNIDNSQGEARASYSYIKPDTTVIMANIRLDSRITDKFTTVGRLSQSNGAKDLILNNISGTPSNTPSMSLYLQQQLPHGQMIVVDVSGSLYKGRSFSDYIESVYDSQKILTDIHTDISDFNKALALEANYIKSWDKSRLTAGGSMTLQRNQSTYRNLNDAVYHQSQNKAYLFAEYFRRMGKITATAGLGAQYSDYTFIETHQGKKSWNLRPQATLTYSPAQAHQLRLAFTSWQSTPVLSQTNPVAQQTDGFQWLVGNPDLKTSSSYQLMLRYGMYLPRVSSTFYVLGYNSPDAIAPTIGWEGDKLVTTYENSRGYKLIRFGYSPQIEVIKDWLIAQGSVRYSIEQMKGSDYRLTNHNWSGNVAMQLMHWGFALTGQYSYAPKQLFGQTISWGECMSTIDLSYNWDKWQFGVGIFMPFGKYDQGSQMLSRWNTNENHLRLDMRMLMVSVSYNLQWGKQRRDVDKLVNADSSTDHSSAAKR